LNIYLIAQEYCIHYIEPLNVYVAVYIMKEFDLLMFNSINAKNIFDLSSKVALEYNISPHPTIYVWSIVYYR